MHIIFSIFAYLILAVFFTKFALLFKFKVLRQSIYYPQDVVDEYLKTGVEPFTDEAIIKRANNESIRAFDKAHPIFRLFGFLSFFGGIPYLAWLTPSLFYWVDSMAAHYQYWYAIDLVFYSLMYVTFSPFNNPLFGLLSELTEAAKREGHGLGEHCRDLRDQRNEIENKMIESYLANVRPLIKAGDLSAYQNLIQEITTTRILSELLTEVVKDSPAEYAMILIRSGADINYEKDREATPLIAAAENSNVECVQALLEAGASVNMTGGRRGSTPLHKAAFSGNIEIVKMLLKAGAQPNIKDWKEDTAYNLAKLIHEPQIKSECLRLLVEAGADPLNKSMSDKMLEEILNKPQSDVVI